LEYLKSYSDLKHVTVLRRGSSNSDVRTDLLNSNLKLFTKLELKIVMILHLDSPNLSQKIIT